MGIRNNGGLLSCFGRKARSPVSDNESKVYIPKADLAVILARFKVEGNLAMVNFIRTGAFGQPDPVPVSRQAADALGWTDR